MKKCKYYRVSEIETYIPSCCVSYGEVDNDVHPCDVGDYCPFCGGKVKLKEYTEHPEIRKTGWGMYQ